MREFTVNYSSTLTEDFKPQNQLCHSLIGATSSAMLVTAQSSKFCCSELRIQPRIFDSIQFDSFGRLHPATNRILNNRRPPTAATQPRQTPDIEIRVGTSTAVEVRDSQRSARTILQSTVVETVWSQSDGEPAPSTAFDPVLWSPSDTERQIERY